MSENMDNNLQEQDPIAQKLSGLKEESLKQEKQVKEKIPVIKCRIKFAKYGVMKFIGHLDIMRFFQKVFRRSGIDIAYTECFSPHQVMSFASPLAVGVCSNGEYLDVSLYSATTSQDMIDRMNAQSVEGIRILSFQQLPEKAEKAMSAVAAASYTVAFREDTKVTIPNLAKVVADFIAQDSIIIEKQGKKTVSQLDLKEHIHELYEKDGSVYMLIDTGSVTHIKPMVIMEQLLMFAGITEKPEDLFTVTREDTYLKQDDQLYPMNAFCTDFI